jgi:hypothetical protein
VLSAAGYEVVRDAPLEAMWAVREGVARVVGCRRPDADVVVLQRPCKRELADAVPHLQDRGVAVVVDIDDDLQTIAADNPAFTDFHPRLHPDRNWTHLARACAAADLVTVSTPALAERYGRHGRVAILPNYVPRAYCEIPRPVAAQASPLCGWTGTPRTHGGDLAQVGTSLGRALTDTGARFLAIGSAETLLALGIPPGAGAWVDWRPIRDGYPELVASLDVGIAPLAPTRFNQAKSWLKPLELAALGVACVVSPSDEYLRLHVHGVGEVARKPKDWSRLLRLLLSDRGYREELSGRGRDAARRLTYEIHAIRWWQAWRTALEQRVSRCA